MQDFSFLRGENIILAIMITEKRENTRMTEMHFKM